MESIVPQVIASVIAGLILSCLGYVFTFRPRLLELEQELRETQEERDEERTAHQATAVLLAAVTKERDDLTECLKEREEELFKIENKHSEVGQSIRRTREKCKR